jgi:Protein of unknown function (DUF2971)
MSTKEMPEVIFHYTSNEVLLKILQGKSLRLSARHYLNDTMEGEQFFSILKTHTSRPDEAKIDSIKKTLDPFEFFVACFSSHGDLLSQWRGYTSNAAGVSIGFSKVAISRAIKSSKEALLYKVAYADDFSTINKNYPDRAKTIHAILTKQGSPSADAIQAFAKERWAIKPTGFEEEQESRLIVTIDTGAGLLNPKTKGFEVDYFATASEVREFCVFNFGNFKKLDFIESITLGPNNKTNTDSLKRHLDVLGMGHVKVMRSAISYR